MFWFSQISQWVATSFQHPGMVAGGAALVASPIIIHLINRMRYRRVRFAAMEFLLQSQQKNRRRLLIEQLLLLLLRILIVLGLLALIARLILNPDQLSLFQGAKTHHVVLLDDSGSMRDRWGETSAYQESLNVVRKLVGDGASRPNTERLTLMLLSRPSEPVFSQESINNEFLTRLESKLENLPSQLTYRKLDLVGGLDEAKKLLSEDRATIKHLHVVSDFRKQDWVNAKAISGAIGGLDEAGVHVNLVRTVPEVHGNLAITDLSGDVHVATAGVPVRLRVAVKNFGTKVAKDVRAAVYQDGQKLALTVPFEAIEPGKEVEHDLDVVFETAKKHSIEVRLEPDALDGDNSRFIAVDALPRNGVLVIDGDPTGEDAYFVAAALAPETGITGFAPLIETTDFLRRQPLQQFQCIYLLNVPELAADAIEPLKDFVAGGGGLVWYMGDLVKPTFYNEKLYEEGKGIFPVPLGLARRDLPPNDGTNPGPDIQFGSHPVFNTLFDQDNPYADLIFVERYLPVAESWQRDDNERKDGVQTIAVLRNKQSLAFEHTYGKGRVVTFLTTAGKSWSNWLLNPSFIALQLELQKRIGRRDHSPEARLVGQSLDFSLNPSEYLGEIEVKLPNQPESPRRLTATPKTDSPASKPEGKPAEPESTGTASARGKGPAVIPLLEHFAETDAPGIYVVSLLRQDDTRDEKLYAFNAPADEGELEIASDADIRSRIGEEVRVDIQQPGSFQWIQGRETGHEIRTALLGLLAVLLLGEQMLACRLSFHPKPAAARA